MISVSRKNSYARRWRSVLPAVLGIVFLSWTSAIAVADVDAKVEAFIKADSLNDSNARFLDIYESLDGDREKIIKSHIKQDLQYVKDIKHDPAGARETLLPILMLKLSAARRSGKHIA